MEEVDDLHQGLLGLVLAGHILEGDAGFLLHIDLGVGLAHAAQAAGAAHLVGHKPEEEDHAHHHNQDGHHIADEHTHQHGGLLDNVGAVLDAVLIQQIGEAVGGDGGRGDEFQLGRFGLGGLPIHPGVHRRIRDSGIGGGCLLRRFAGLGLLLLPGEEELAVLLGDRHVVLQGNDILVALGLHLRNEVLPHPLAEGGVVHLHRVGALEHADGGLEQQREDQGPQEYGYQADPALLIAWAAVFVAVVILIIGLQVLALLISTAENRAFPSLAVLSYCTTPDYEIQGRRGAKGVNFL